MKPLGAYGPAFELGTLTPDSYVEDLPLNINGWTPKIIIIILMDMLL